MPQDGYQTSTVDGWRFVRVSAPYIDVFPPGSDVAVDCINVYDYAKGEPTLPIPAARSRFRGVCRQWLTENASSLDDFEAMGRSY